MIPDQQILQQKIDLKKLKKDIVHFITESKRRKELMYRYNLAKRGITQIKVKDPNQILIPFLPEEREAIEKEIELGVVYFIEKLLIKERKEILKKLIENTGTKN